MPTIHCARGSLFLACSLLFTVSVAACGDDPSTGKPPPPSAVRPADGATEARPADSARPPAADATVAAGADASSDALTGDAALADAAPGNDLKPPPLPGEVEIDAAASDATRRDAGAPARDAAAPDATPATPSVPSLNTGLLLFLPLDDGPANHRPRDVSGHGATVEFRETDIANAYVEGRFGLGLGLRRAPGSGWLSVASSEPLNKVDKGLSISVWIKRPALGDGEGTIVARRALGPGGYLYSFQITDNRLRLRLHTANGYRLDLAGETLVPRGVWTHVAVTYDVETARLFVDGKPSATSRFGLAIPAENTPITIGAAGAPAGLGVVEPLVGALDDLLMYGRALTSEEIGQLARGARPQAR